ncbi:dedicator of cytokinesis protein 7-like isoform X2 [Limulus polyphemus]|uniref:Dedicator of cytokinesis protein 7-like isoform X2 n=1 Tax=Limulus polyphemus TaxID=6850 RepID=A0ABM1SA89_LIMPO|nr:dedicator of cytokinesis protein 7-like isoform X2 [Limulus polyphemus]
MASGQRAFAQRLSKQSNADVRRQIAAASSGRDIPRGGGSSVRNSVPLCDVVDPVDFEDFLQQHQEQIDHDPIRHLLEFPADDIEVGIIPRKCRTVRPIIPEENESELDPYISDCIQSYTSDWVFVNRRYQQYSTSCGLHDGALEQATVVRATPKQEFEVDLEEEIFLEKDSDKASTCVSQPFSNQPPLPLPSQPPLAEDEDISDSSLPPSNRQSVNLGDTPRASWASSVFDLHNSQSDSLIASLLDRAPADELDRLNELKRHENRQEGLFALYRIQNEEDVIERRLPAETPKQHLGHRILVKCLQLKLELEIEPLFGIMALYDAKEKKKVSENFCFDLNPEPFKRMLSSHVPYQDISTLSRSCIFNITYPSPDLFLVVKLEKVLQGDINECAEPYMKDDKNRDKVKSNAVSSCDRLGKYRMPFAWTAIYLMNIFNGVNSLDRDSVSNKDGSRSNSLDRKGSNNSLENFRKKSAGDSGSLGRRGSLERRSGCEKRRSWSPDDFGSSLDNFRAVTLTVNSFFKQESDRLRDEDLYKLLLELKRSSSVLKRLKCIPGTLKLDISPCPEEVRYCLTSDLTRLHPYPDEKGRPTKELMEFPPKEVFVPHYVYQNLMFVYPKDLNFTNRPGSARNIACKTQFMAGEEEHCALPVIFGKSSCPEFSQEAYTTVTYHNKCPSFYDEIKIKLPAKLSEQHHLLFTFYHISCQKKVEQTPIETPVGYTWLPLYRDGRIQTGEHNLPVIMESPPSSYCFLSPSVEIPNTKWVDNHKGVFNVVVEAVSSIHAQDEFLDRFLHLCTAMDENLIPSRIGEANIENELKNSILKITNSNPERLVQFLPIILNKLICLLVRPPIVAGQVMNIGQTAFESIANIVKSLVDLLESQNDQHGRNNLLTTYIHYQCTLPHLDMYPMSGHVTISGGYSTGGRPISLPPQRLYHERSSSNPDIASFAEADLEVGNILNRHLDRTGSMRSAILGQDSAIYSLSKSHTRKIVHEELALQWVVSSGSARELALSNAWFFFELMVKSMNEYLASSGRLEVPRKMRFSEQFMDDISTLVTTMTSDIISRYNREVKDMKFIQGLNTSLAFFMFDLLSILDRGYVLQLIKTYCKQMAAKISSFPDAGHLISLKLEFLRIICSHEHFVTLNLPFATPLTPSPTTSPTPSVASSTSRSSFASNSTIAEKGSFAELSTEFRHQHFLVGLVLSDLATVMELNNPAVHAKAVNTVRNLLTSHDWDPRFVEPEVKARVATLYLPLVGIVMDSLFQLYDWPTENRGRPVSISEDGGDQNLATFPQSVANAIASSGVYTRGSAGGGMISHYDPCQQSNRKCQLKEETTRHLLMCFLWIIKNTDKTVLQQWWAELPYHRLQQLLEVLLICVSCFEYKGKKALQKYRQQSLRKTSDMKSKLEEAILGHSCSARSEMMMRRKGEKNPPSPNPYQGDKLRWRKDQVQWRHNAEQLERPKVEVETEAHIEANLSTEVNMIILDTLELIVQVVVNSDSLPGLLGVILRVLLHALGCNQSTTVLQNMFATQRSLVFKFPELLFEEETEQCADLCLRLLKHCSSCISTVRSQASASLYLLMRQNFEIGNNFARVKMQVTMSLSSLVGTNQNFNEAYLRRSLKTILVYAESDSELQETTFPEQVRDLVFNLHMILSDTVKMKEFQEDPEMLMDLMYRIAKGYQNSPDLRLTWLANMAQKHTERFNHAEAAHCLVHSAALVAEYLHMLEDKPYLPIGCVSFESLSYNILEESAVSDDILSPDEEGICTGKYFTENGLIGLLEQAASSFSLAGMYEAMNEVYKILIPIAEAHRDYKKLANIHSKLHEAFTKIDQQTGKRVFGTYFRVGFYGYKFGDLDEKEFIYKEPTLTKLPEISHRLENFYAERFGAEYAEVIKDSNTVDSSKLNPEKAYIQITYVEPYFEMYEERNRVTYFEKNYNINCFVYATPFTPDGRAHGDLHEQFKRRTILTTENSFPYVKTRVQVTKRKQVVLTPIEVAIDDIRKKTKELAIATWQEPADPKILQMVLQGCIGTTVNQGPMEVAIVFLSDLVDGTKTPTPLQNKLRLCFKDFSKKCSDALRKNRNLIGPDQRDYQKELERNYQRFTDRIAPMLRNNGTAVLRAGRDSQVDPRQKTSPMV